MKLSFIWIRLRKYWNMLQTEAKIYLAIWSWPYFIIKLHAINKFGIFKGVRITSRPLSIISIKNLDQNWHSHRRNFWRNLQYSLNQSVISIPKFRKCITWRVIISYIVQSIVSWRIIHQHWKLGEKRIG